jgi:hypothetical protein
MYYYYIINNELVNNTKAMEWMKDNENTEVICKGRVHRKFKYINGYFTSYIWTKPKGREWEPLTTYYKRLPETSYEEDILRFFDEKQWCPI